MRDIGKPKKRRRQSLVRNRLKAYIQEKEKKKKI
jgi:hypothetical protein